MARPKQTERVYPSKDTARQVTRTDVPGAEVWFYETTSTKGTVMICAYGWKSGRQVKWDFHNSYPSEEVREKTVNGWFDRLADRHKQEEKLKRGSDQPNPFKERDIIYNSWGYDQTNIDFYQVVEVKEKSIVIRAICQETVKQDDEHGMTERVVARRDKFKEDSEPMTKRVQWFMGEAMISMDHGAAKLWNGKPMYQSHTC